VQPLRALVQEIVAGSIDALAFTSQIQLRHLLRIADEDGLKDAVVTALNGPVPVAAIGPTCAAALIEAHITPRVVPDPPKLIPMLTGLAEWLATSSGGSARQSH
jgi:uroporphyrinogen-III synthase